MLNWRHEQDQWKKKRLQGPRVVQGHDFLVTLSDPVTLHCVGWRNDEQEARVYFYAAEYSLHRNTIYRSIPVRYKSYFSIIA